MKVGGFDKTSDERLARITISGFESPDILNWLTSIPPWSSTAFIQQTHLRTASPCWKKRLTLFKKPSQTIRGFRHGSGDARSAIVSTASCLI